MKMLPAKNTSCILTSAVVRRDCNRQKHFGRGSAKNLLTICYFLEKGIMSKHGIIAGHNFFRRNSQPLTSHLQQSGKDESDKKFSWPIFIQEKSFRIRYQNEGKESHRRWKQIWIAWDTKEHRFKVEFIVHCEEKKAIWKWERRKAINNISKTANWEGSNWM